MNQDLVGWTVGLAVTVVPLGLSTWWGARHHRRLRRETYEQLVLTLRFDLNPWAEAMRQLTESFARLGEAFAPAAQRMAAVFSVLAMGDDDQEADDASGG